MNTARRLRRANPLDRRAEQALLDADALARLDHILHGAPAPGAAVPVTEPSAAGSAEVGAPGNPPVPTPPTRPVSPAGASGPRPVRCRAGRGDNGSGPR
ncbi:MAG: hypothetical protein LBM66_02205, partial [Bifidobacteriaceae bacterium]|nr:hypothetical protein [Bifidobacteriaceae bacterium]